jgi:hypothetical protein
MTHPAAEDFSLEDLRTVLSRFLPDASGEIKLAIGIERGKVMIYFGQPISFFALTKEQCAGFTEAVAALAECLP